jgi:DNA-binding CsgD family transcriptional regulator
MADNLSDTQLEIVMHLCNGKTRDEVADAMNYSPAAIDKFLRSAKSKVGAKTTIHLASIAIASGNLVYTHDGERAHYPTNDGTEPPAARYSADTGSPAPPP